MKFIIIILNLLLSAFFVAASQCRPAESYLKNQKYFRKVSGHDKTLPEEHVVSSHAVPSKVECSLKCLQALTCVGYNYRSKSNKYLENCQLSSKTRQKDQRTGIGGEWTFYQTLETDNEQNKFSPGCTRAKALGMEDGVIRDKQITASSEYSSNHQASNGRLNFNAKKGAWSAKTIDLNQWLQVDFQRSTIITGISTQGRIQYSQFVTSYTISFSDDENNFQSVKAAGIQKVKRGEEIAKEFQGNYDVNSIVYHDIAPAIKARFIRVHPTGWERYISMRVEFYGCFFEEWAN